MVYGRAGAQDNETCLMEFHDAYTTRDAPDILWNLLVERNEEPEINISHTMPTRDQHEAFIKRTPYAYWFLIKVEGNWIGYVNVTWKNEVGIILFRAYRGTGYGKKALRKLLDEVVPLPGSASERPDYFVANINPANERSIHLFQSLGFKLHQLTFALRRSHGEEASDEESIQRSAG